MPDAGKDDPADGISEWGMVCKGVDGAGSLVWGVEVEGVVEERGGDAEELTGDEKGGDGGEEIGVRWNESESEYAGEEFFWKGCE